MTTAELAPVGRIEARSGDGSLALRSPEPNLARAEVIRTFATYRKIRVVAGCLGIALPVALVVGKPLVGLIHQWIGGRNGDGWGWGIESSMSRYYYTDVRGLFVGALFAIGVLMLSYNYSRVDSVLTNFACLFAIGIALFPTPMDGELNVLAVLHFASAGLLFVMLGMIAYFRFPVPDRPADSGETIHHRRARLYRTCGSIIFGCIALAIVLFALEKARGHDFAFPWLLVVEAVMVEAFGISWLVKSGWLRVPGLLKSNKRGSLPNVDFV